MQRHPYHETEIALSHGVGALACVCLYIQTCVVHIAPFGGIAVFYAFLSESVAQSKSAAFVFECNCTVLAH